jgi:parallel beta-helix repeat protein
LKKRFAILILSFIILSSLAFEVELNPFQVIALNSFPVHNVNTGLNYTSVQGAIDAPETVAGNTILVDSGKYSEHLVIGKSIALVGAGRNTTAIDGGGIGIVIQVTASDVLIKGFEVENGLLGILLDHSNNSAIIENNVNGVVSSSAPYSLYVDYSHNFTIEQNIIGPNSASGLLITNSEDFTISKNYAYNNNGYGLNVNDSMNGIIEWNVALNNTYDGIGLGMGSSNCTVMGNSVSGNQFWGIWLDSDSVDNLIYDNNIIGSYGLVSVNLPNRWDNGLEGNFWSNYSGPDLNRDGIIDEPLLINDNNIDNHALSGELSSFQAYSNLRVNVISNSSIASLTYIEPNGTIILGWNGSATNQDSGFCRVSIPHGLVTGPYEVTIDNTAPSYVNDSLHDDGATRWMYFNYPNSGREVSIQGVDKTVPNVSLLSPENRTYDASKVQLVFSVDGSISSIAYSLDDKANATIDGNTTISGISQGTHHVVVYVKDLAGNMGSSVRVYFGVSVGGETPIVQWVVIVIVAGVVVTVALLVYFRRRRNRTKIVGG